MKISNILIQQIQDTFPGLSLRQNVSFRDVTTLGAGGEIALLAEPADDIVLKGLLKFCYRNELKTFMLGGGSNLVGCDGIFDGVAIRLRQNHFSRVSFGRNHVTIGCGARLPELVRECVKAGYGQFAPFAGIPGTVGGALRMNAGAHGAAIGDFVLELFGCHLKDGSPWAANQDQLEWGYRQSSVPEDVCITGAIFRLGEKSTPEEAKAQMDVFLEQRRKHEPAGRSAGCAWRNPSSLDPAGKLIDLCGLKGKSCGEAKISTEHANYLLNSGCASAGDILELLKATRKTVAEKMGVYLCPEYKFVDQRMYEELMQVPRAVSVAVLMGGNSSERSVSLRSGAAVAAALRRANYRVQEFDITECQLPDGAVACDVIFPVLHGGFGEDGRLQKVMEDSNCVFVGCGSAAAALTMDKIQSKELAEHLNLPTAKWGKITRNANQLPEHLTFPVIVKVPCEGSSIGMAKVDSREEWNDKVMLLFDSAEELLVEEYISGGEFTVPVLENGTLPAIEIVSPSGFYDYDAKYVYQHGHTEYFCPMKSYSAELESRAAAVAEAFFRGAGCRDLLRVDFMTDSEGQIYFLEGNSLPGFTATSLVPKAAQAAGISFERLCGTLVQQALERK